MSGLKSGLTWLALAVGVAGAQAEEPKVAPLSTEGVTTTTQAATQRLMVAINAVVVAQAAPPESDGKPYFADVLQIDWKTKVRVTYFRDKQWAIIPPAVVDGKLVDGSPAPEDVVRARIAQRKILVPYDKNAQIALAMVGDRDLIKESRQYLTLFMDNIESWKVVSKSDFEIFLFHTYIAIEAWSKWDGIMKLADNVATIKLKLTPVEYATMKSEAQAKAKKIWKATTGAVA